LAIWKQIANGAHSSASILLFSIHTAVGIGAIWTNLVSVSNGAMNSGNLLFSGVTAIDVNIVKYVTVGVVDTGSHLAADNVDNSDLWVHWAAWIIRGPGEGDICKKPEVKNLMILFL
jgi:hypothetical protein